AERGPGPAPGRGGGRAGRPMEGRPDRGGHLRPPRHQPHGAGQRRGTDRPPGTSACIDGPRDRRELSPSPGQDIQAVDDNLPCRIFGKRVGAALTATAALSCLPEGAGAQTVIPAGTNFMSTTGAAPANGSSWLLGGSGIFLQRAVTLPAGTPGLTLGGAGNTLTLNDGQNPIFGYFITGAQPVTLSLSNITITGGA